MSDARRDIFARLRGTCIDATAASIEAEREALGSGLPPAPPAEELCEAFLRNVLRNRGTIDRAQHRKETVDAVRRFLHDTYRSQRLVAGNDPRLAALPWRDAGLLPRFGSLEHGEPVALSYAQLGIAELGGVVTTTGKSNPSVNNLLPQHHIVLLDVEDLVPAMEQAWERLALTDPAARTRGVNIIAGPSSTADIGGQLVYGAHGPIGWHVILLGEVPQDALQRALGSQSGA